MSCTPTSAVEVCANCGKEGNDAIKLKNCTACLLVKYCGVDCQKTHRKQHKKACKKRAAELKDEKLYGQGHERTEFDFCPLCYLATPLPITKHAKLYFCCMKLVCNGCLSAAIIRGLNNVCPFCRAPIPTSEAEGLALIQKRAAARDPEAVRQLGGAYHDGSYGLDKDLPRGMELWSEAAELGSTGAHWNLGIVYYNGRGVAHDKAKGIRHWELAAMQGDACSRHKLGLHELVYGKNRDRAVRHFLISAKMGLKESLDAIKKLFAQGDATKAEYAEALKGYQGALEEMKSAERDEVE